MSEDEKNVWKKCVCNISEDYVFKEPATSKEIEEVEKKFNVKLPAELRSLLEETDGIYDEFGCYLVWSTSNIIVENTDRRTDEDFADWYMPIDSLLFVADAGNGDLFGYSISNGTIQKDDIYVWKHEDDSRTWVAP